MLAKIIVTGATLDDALSKMALALQRTTIIGVDTNLDFLLAIVTDQTYLGDNLRHTHIKSLEERTPALLDSTRSWMEDRRQRMVSSTAANTSHATNQAATASPSTLHFKPEDAFNIVISALDSKSSTTAYTLQLDAIQTNNFPDELVAHAQSTIPALPSHFAMTLKKKSALGSGLRRKATPQSAGEVASPVTGMLVELSVQEGDAVALGQELFVMSAMKMETVVKSSVNGRVQAVYAKPNELVEIGDLVVELSEKKDSKI